ncbi:MAG TPA: hypothetical protein VM073_06935 [Usitatibacter sp.]|nr:hypothetical protein [Usitatibacter sp.]
MRRALAILVVAAAAPAWAVFGTQLHLDVRDAADRPSPGAFVVARELGELGKLHGTVTYCIRAAAKTTSTTVTKLDLPGATLEAVMLRDRRLEVLAYRPGHCVARAKDVESATLRLRPAPNRADERLPYLEELAVSLVCRRGGWSSGSTAVVEKLIAAIDAEVKPLVHGPWERQIADRIRVYLKIAKGFPSIEDMAQPASLAEPKPLSPRDFIIVPSTYASQYDNRKGLWIAAPPRPREEVVILAAPSGNRPGQAAAVQGGGSPFPIMSSGGGSAADRAPPTIRCRFGEPSQCNLDQRDESGETALGTAVKYFRVDEARVLLQGGASPGVPVTPGGPTPAELVQERMKNYSPGSWDVQQGQQILGLLAASPKARPAGAPAEAAPCEPLNVLSPIRLR